MAKQEQKKEKKIRTVQNPLNTKVASDFLEIEYIRGYKMVLSTTLIYWGTIVLSSFILLLVYHWFPRLKLKMKYRESSLNEADYIYVKGMDQTFTLCRVSRLATGKAGLEFNDSSDKLDKYIEYKFIRMFYNMDRNTFERKETKTEYSRKDIHDLCKSGLSTRNHLELIDFHGPNEINVPVKSIPKLLLEEVLHPFFIFQIYSILLWIAEAYYYYSIAIFVIATTSAVFTLRETRNNLIRLSGIAKYICNVTVLRNGQFLQTTSDTLVPGDIVELSTSTLLPCDFSLLTGTVILNESMLTGESIPVTKYALEECSGNILSIDPTVNKRCAMSGGTLVVKTQAKAGERILAMVTKTGWMTTKGELVLSMLYPKSSHFKFFQQSVKFLLVLCAIALVGFGISVWRLLKLGVPHSEVVIRALDLITIVVPPALPMAQSVGTGFSILRLKAQSIFCVSPPRVSMAGKVEVFCFDKTGTLTEDGLDLLGVVPAHHKQFQPMVSECERLIGPLYLTMATCHTLAHIDEVVSGDPLEEKIFNATKAKLNDNHHSYCATIKVERDLEINDQLYSVHPISTKTLEQSEEIALVERFEFQSALQRMSVIVRGLISDKAHSQDFSIVKGSPEMIKRLSVESSIPLDYDSILATYTKKGYRVLAAGYKEWDNKFSEGKTKDEIRDEAEKDLHFIGFIVMENKIKKETPPALAILKAAAIRMIMVTGDNVLTAVSVSRDCGLLDQDKTIFMSEVVKDPNTNKNTILWHDVTSSDDSVPYRLDPNTLTVDNGAYDFNNYVLAVTGDAWKMFYEKFKEQGPSIAFNQILKKGHIFARMTPDQKQNLVEELQNLNLYVGMCGDGANDCGALKAAHVGISLSVAEASIAAPFTSTITNITCTHQLVREGRASLSVSFKLFQFIGMYSLIQFTQVILLYMDGSVLGNWMYLYQDLWVIFPLVIFMGRTEPCTKLSIKRPSSRLIGPTVIASLFSHVVLTGIFQTIVFIYVQKQPWYEVKNSPADIVTYICTSLFIYGNLQYSIMAFIYSWGKPFLRPIYTNKLLFMCFVITLTTSFLILLVPTAKVWTVAQLLEVPLKWRLELLILAIINAVFAFAIESFIMLVRDKRTKEKRKRKALADSDSSIMAKNTVNNQYTSVN